MRLRFSLARLLYFSLAVSVFLYLNIASRIVRPPFNTTSARLERGWPFTWYSEDLSGVMDALAKATGVIVSPVRTLELLLCIVICVVLSALVALAADLLVRRIRARR